ncbi:MAG: hypothetical protein AUK03_15335 [Anaerolineae bacterium CG2_30_64_16]|nr:MAG: hypothetical protein AUK03_15335 [Anaerolineae bacterium CG2_30_64_16]
MLIASYFALSFGVRLTPDAILFRFRQGEECRDRQSTYKKITILHGAEFRMACKPAIKVAHQFFLHGGQVRFFRPDCPQFGYQLNQTGFLSLIKRTDQTGDLLNQRHIARYKFSCAAHRNYLRTI